jgi:uncharacterized protein (DUF1800 family)
MAIDRKFTAALALHRFGFGPVPGAIAAIADDPRGALLAELERPGAGQVAAANLPDSAAAARELLDFRAERLAQRKLAEQAKKEAPAGAASPAAAKSAGAGAAGASAAAGTNAQAGTQPSAADGQKRPPGLPLQLVQNEAEVRIEAALSSQIGFVERLVWFWSNHFCVSNDRVIAVAGSYEREAIRPHVLGRFLDMLTAVESHPAMLYYLDNFVSMGPHSIAGINQNRGLNENLAREALELHTLGVRSGYSQADVTGFANVLTGWTFIGVTVPNHGGEFVFVKRMHEPGEQVVLGKHYLDTGFEQGRAVLADLAAHPATARHIARKLAVHFVADEPPQSLVDKLAERFIVSDGDLKEVAKALIGADESWTPQRTKLKRPFDWHIAALRLAGGRGVVARFMGAQASLGEPMWRPPGPNGFPEYESAWIDGLPQRADIASTFAGRVADRIDPIALVDEGLGPLASTETRDAVGRASDRAQALTLLLMAPEFLRR